MRSSLKRLGEPLKYAEFTVPGSLLLMIGAAFGIFPMMTGFGHISWPYAAGAGLLIACGIGLLSRHIVGSVLFLGVLGYWLYRAILSGWPSDWNDALRFLLGMLLLYSFADCALLQFRYHRKLRKSPSEVIPPPASKQV